MQPSYQQNMPQANMQMNALVNVSTQGISGDYQMPNGDQNMIPRGSFNRQQLEELLRQIVQFRAPSDQMLPPQIHIQGPAGQFCFIADGGIFFSYEIDTQATVEEAIGYVFGLRQNPQVVKRQKKKKGGPFRWLLALVITFAIGFFAFAGGAALINNFDEPIYKVAGFSLIVSVLTILKPIFKGIRG